MDYQSVSSVLNHLFQYGIVNILYFSYFMIPEDKLIFLQPGLQQIYIAEFIIMRAFKSDGSQIMIVTLLTVNAKFFLQFADRSLNYRFTRADTTGGRNVPAVRERSLLGTSPL